MYTLLCAGFVGLAGCNPSSTPAAGPTATASVAAPASTIPATAPVQAGTAATAASYVPPSADQLYQLVAPIALFPDNLVAQVLAGSTYPDQITAAEDFVTRNPGLKGSALSAQIDPQPWDASVKALTTFPSVLDQMARNAQWTTALGNAYANDPSDVMNAIQVMRQRASKQGNLRSTAQQKVATQPAVITGDIGADEATDEPQDTYYEGPSMVQAPAQTIEIMPAQEDTVYVPSYDPQTVYGDEVPAYPDYSYEEPRGYSNGQLVTAGAVSFGVGILVGSLLEQHHRHDRSNDYRDSNDRPPGGGWHSWGVNWGGRRGGGAGWQRPSVIHNNTHYVSNSTTIVNRVTHNTTINNRSNNRTTINNGSGRPVAAAPTRGNEPRPGTPAAQVNGRPGAPTPRAVVSMPHFGPGGRQPVTPVPQRRPPAGAPQSGHPVVTAPAPKGPMSMPHFGKPPAHATPVPAGTGTPGRLRRPPNTLAPNPGPMKAVPAQPSHPQAPPAAHAPVRAPTHAPTPVPVVHQRATSPSMVAPGTPRATPHPALHERPASPAQSEVRRPPTPQRVATPRPASLPPRPAEPRPVPRQAPRPMPVQPRPAPVQHAQPVQQPKPAARPAAHPQPAHADDKKKHDDKH
jgi:hypothetical protein